MKLLGKVTCVVTVTKSCKSDHIVLWYFTHRIFGLLNKEVEDLRPFTFQFSEHLSQTTL